MKDECIPPSIWAMNSWKRFLVEKAATSVSRAGPVDGMQRAAPRTGSILTTKCFIIAAETADRCSAKSETAFCSAAAAK